MATKYPRSFIYKTYKILCKMLDVEAICFGKLYKKAKTECIYAIDSSGQKFPFICKIVKNRYANLTIRKNAKKSDIQKEIVLRILKALETEDVCMYRGSRVDMPCVEKGTCFEEKVIEYDLRCRVPMKHDSLRKME